ncbi:hypothetical protein ACFVFF_06440 [Streptomyces sp. NPDC057680]|uniref:hypothetical protein n=1 Tax=Streptomyces sp. NPDC057680 TaxID=3346208 RepID=UPI00367CB4CA
MPGCGEVTANSAGSDNRQPRRPGPDSRTSARPWPSSPASVEFTTQPPSGPGRTGIRTREASSGTAEPSPNIGPCGAKHPVTSRTSTPPSSHRHLRRRIAPPSYPRSS